MATVIHHGAPGSYKSFAVVQRFVIPALQSGRTVVTNIRGLEDIELFYNAFPKIIFPDSAKLIFIDTTKETARLILACWYKWIPFKCLLVIDEAQRIYPDRRDFKLESLDLVDIPPSIIFDDLPLKDKEGKPLSRPEDVFTAFDMQRHFEWDLYLTSTNIGKIKSEIRQVAEWAYWHRNVSGMLPWIKNTWYEFQHDPENNGKSLHHRVGKPKEYKADPRVFKCYQSTATGEITTTFTGSKVFSDSAVLSQFGILFVAVIFFLYILFSGSASMFTGKKVYADDKALVQTIQKTVNSDSKENIKDIPNDIHPLSNVKDNKDNDSLYSRLVSVSLFDAQRGSYEVNVIDDSYSLISVDVSTLPQLKVFSTIGYCRVLLIFESGKIVKLSCFSLSEKCTSISKTSLSFKKRGCSLLVNQKKNLDEVKKVDNPLGIAFSDINK